MNNSALPHGPDRELSFSRLSPRKKPRKPFVRFVPGNPLISLDSDERIQGSPRKSNTHQRGPSQRNGQGPRKPKQIDRTNLAARCQEGAKPTPSKCKRPRCRHRSRSLGSFGPVNDRSSRTARGRYRVWLQTFSDKRLARLSAGSG